MLKDVLKLSWEELMDSELDFKSNNVKHVAQFDGECVGVSGGIVLIYYNLMTGTPMLCIVNKDGRDTMQEQDVPGFRATKEVSQNEDGEWYTEIVYLDNAMRQALS